MGIALIELASGKRFKTLNQMKDSFTDSYKEIH